MIFIFPANFDFKSKLFGFIDYNVAVVIVVWSIFIFCLLNLIFKNITLKVFLFIIFCFPLVLLNIIGFNQENFLYVIYYFIKFLCNRKIYLYQNDFF